MEARVAERLVHLALLSCVLCVVPALGKYVKGIVDTKEVSEVHVRLVILFIFYFHFMFFYFCFESSRHR